MRILPSATGEVERRATSCGPPSSCAPKGALNFLLDLRAVNAISRCMRNRTKVKGRL
jgi:hypothetical protein